MRLVAWNIMRGGANRIEAIADSVLLQMPDIVVLGEYMPRTSDPLVERLAGAGLRHTSLSKPPKRRGGIAVASRYPMLELDTPVGMSEGFYRYRPLSIPDIDLELRGVYAPLKDDPFAEYWESLLAELESERDKPVLLIGDFNSGLPRLDTTADTLFCSKYFKQLPDRGYSDLWRQNNQDTSDFCTWRGPVNDYRLDHAFASASLAERVVACDYDHSVRLNGTSDHSMLTLEVE